MQQPRLPGLQCPLCMEALPSPCMVHLSCCLLRSYKPFVDAELFKVAESLFAALNAHMKRSENNTQQHGSKRHRMESQPNERCEGEKKFSWEGRSPPSFPYGVTSPLSPSDQLLEDFTPPTPSPATVPPLTFYGSHLLFPVEQQLEVISSTPQELTDNSQPSLLDIPPLTSDPPRTPVPIPPAVINLRAELFAVSRREVYPAKIRSDTMGRYYKLDCSRKFIACITEDIVWSASTAFFLHPRHSVTDRLQKVFGSVHCVDSNGRVDSVSTAFPTTIPSSSSSRGAKVILFYQNERTESRWYLCISFSKEIYMQAQWLTLYFSRSGSVAEQRVEGQISLRIKILPKDSKGIEVIGDTSRAVPNDQPPSLSKLGQWCSEFAQDMIL